MAQVRRRGLPIGNHRELPTLEDGWLEDLTLESLYDVIQVENLDVKKILWQLKQELESLRIETSIGTNAAYQTLVTSATNLTSGTLNGSTGTQSVLTTASASQHEFDWPNPKRESLIIVGPGDGVEPHIFTVNPDPKLHGEAWGKDSSGNDIQARGLVMPYAIGTDQQLIFFYYDEADSYKTKPANLGIGTTIYLQQRLPADE